MKLYTWLKKINNILKTTPKTLKYSYIRVSSKVGKVKDNSNNLPI